MAKSSVNDIFVDIFLDLEASFDPTSEQSYQNLKQLNKRILNSRATKRSHRGIVSSQHRAAHVIDLAYSTFNSNKKISKPLTSFIKERQLAADPKKFVGDFWKTTEEPRKLLEELRSFASGKTTATKFIQPIDALTEFLEHVDEQAKLAAKVGKKVRISGWSLQYDLSVLIGNIEGILSSGKRKDPAIAAKLHKLSSVYNQFVDHIQRKTITTHSLETGFLKYRAALVAKAYEKYGQSFISNTKLNESAVKHISNVIRKGDAAAFDELISGRTAKFGGYRVEDVLRFLDIYGGKEKHRAAMDVLQETDIALRFRDFNPFVDDPFEYAKKVGGKSVTAITDQQVFYKRAIKEIIVPDRMGRAVAGEAAAAVGSASSQIVKGQSSIISRLALGKISSNKAIKIAGIGALAVVGLGVVQRLWDSAGDDDYSNKHEALIGSSHKKFGIFGSGYRGGRSDYLDRKIEEARSRGSMFVGASYVGLPTREIRQKLVSNIVANSPYGGAGGFGGRKKNTTYSETAAGFGTFAHQIAQREMMDTGSYTGKTLTWRQNFADAIIGRDRGKGITPEYKAVSQETGMYGSIDVLQNEVIIEHKFVTAGIFETIVRTGKPFPSHVLQINAYMGMLGKRKAQLIYTNRENLQQRIVFDVDFGEKAYKQTARKVRKASRQAMRDALEMGVDVSSLPVNEDITGQETQIPSMEELKERYPVELFHALTVRRGIPTNLEKLREDRDLEQQRVRARKGNIIEGMRHGWFGSSRKDRTDFGSGFRPEDEYGTPDNVWTSRAVAVAAVGGFAYGMAKHPVWLYNKIKKLEDRSPLQILKTFRLSERLQPRVISALDSKGKQVIPASALLIRGGSAMRGRSYAYADTSLTKLGMLVQNLLGELPIDEKGNLVFTKAEGNFYKIAVGGQEKFVTFASANTRLASAAFRYNKRTGEKALSDFEVAATKRMSNMPEWFKAFAGMHNAKKTKTEELIYKAGLQIQKLKLSQIEQKLTGVADDAVAPIYATTKSTPILRTADIFLQKSRRAALGGLERFNRLIAEFGVALPAGSFNRVLTVPWNDVVARTPVGKKLGMQVGRRGFINQLLAKRYFPIAAIAATAGLLDYVTGHTVSDMPVETYANTQIGMSTVARMTGLNKYKELINTISPVPDYGIALATLSTAAIGSQIYANRLAASNNIAPALSRLGVTQQFSTYEKFSTRAGQALASESYTPAYQTLKKKLLTKSLKGAALLAAPFIASALIPEESPQELRDIYSGRQEIEVMKGRWWETSSTPYEGDKTKEFRQHFVARFLNRQWIKDEYGSEGEYWKRNLGTPIGWFNLLTDPYGKEVEAAKRGRNFPLTEELFLDVPFSDITGLRFIGHALKPPKFMHARSVEDFARMYESENPDLEPSYELGGLKPLVPQMPWSLRNMAARTFSQYTTVAGLPGFIGTTTSKKLLGEENVFIDKYTPTLQAANEIGNQERWFYGLELGGAAFLSEPVRRYIQRTPRQFGAPYNPIPNDLPDWLSGKNELKDLATGDAIAKVGFNARYLPPRGEGEEYNELQKAEALAHVQPYSRRLTRMFSALDEVALEPMARYRVEELKQQVKAIKEREKFSENTFATPLAGYSGTVEQVEGEYLKLKEYPFKEFKVGGFALNYYQTAKNFIRTENISIQRAAMRAAEVQEKAREHIEKQLTPGTRIGFAAAAGAPENLRQVDIAVYTSNGLLNREVKDKYNLPIEQNKAISQLMYSAPTRAMGTVAESIFHDPALPTMAKFAGKYTALEKYKKERVYGKKIKLWDNPIESFIMQPAYGASRRFGSVVPFNPFSGFDDEYNSIEGLKGNVHQQFGVFGSGFINKLGNIMETTLSKILFSGKGMSPLVSSEKYLLIDADKTLFGGFLDTAFNAVNRVSPSIARDLYASSTARFISSRIPVTKQGKNVLSMAERAKSFGFKPILFTDRPIEHASSTIGALKRSVGDKRIENLFEGRYYFGAGKKQSSVLPESFLIDDRITEYGSLVKGGLHPGSEGIATAFIRQTTPFGSGFASSDRYVPVPGYTENIRKYNEYFDKLEYIKWIKLAKQAEEKGHDRLISYYMAKARGTMIGINPLIAEPEQVMQVLPKSERPYFAAFANEPNPEKRQEIMEMLPASQRRLMAGTWFRQMNHASMLEEEIPQYREYVRNEGYMTDAEKQVIPGLAKVYGGAVEPAALDRMAEIYQFLDENNLPLPSENWKGWQAQIDMQDLKLMYLKSIGEDIHEYDLWEDRERMLARKPYLKNTLGALRNNFNPSGTISVMDGILKDNGVLANRYSSTPTTETSFTLNFGVDPDTMLYDTDFNRAIDDSMRKTRPGFDNLDLYLGRM